MTTQFLASDVSIQEEQPVIKPIPSLSTNKTGAVAVAERGPVNQEVIATSPDEWNRVFGSHIANSDASLFVQMFFQNGGAELHFVRAVHCTDPSDPNTKTSAAATVNLKTAAIAAAGAAVTGSNTAPWRLTPGDTLVFSVDGGGNLTATFNATAAVLECANAENYVMTDGMTLTVEIDGGSVQTVTFHTGNFVSIGAATAEEVTAVINAQISGASASATSSGTKVSITSDLKGTGSHVQVTGGTANAVLGFDTGLHTGTGNVANILAVTFTEAKAVVEGAVAGVTATSVNGGELRVTTNATGSAHSILVVASSSADDEFGLDNATHTGTDNGALDTIRADAKSDGSFGNNLQPIIENATNGAAGDFNFKTQYNGVVVERWPNLSMDPLSSRYFEKIVNDPNVGSVYFKLTDLEAAIDAPNNRPVNGTFGPLTGGNDGLTSLADADFIGAAGASGDTGLRCLDEVTDLSLVTVPGRATPAVHNAIITYCEIIREGLCFGVLDPPLNQTATEIVDYVQNTAAIQRLSEYVAIYWPNVLISNPSVAVFGNVTNIVAPPSGAICGLYTRIDGSKPSGVFEHPAGTDNGKLFGIAGFEMPEVKKKSHRDIVVPQLINPISTEPGQPIFVDGALTLKDDGSWPSIGQRRGIIFLEASLKIGLTFMRHRRINARLFNEGAKTVTAFMDLQTANGAFSSSKPSEAYQIDFGPGLNTAASKKAKQVFARLSVATDEPGQWIVLKVTPDQRALEAELAAAAA